MVGWVRGRVFLGESEGEREGKRKILEMWGRGSRGEGESLMDLNWDWAIDQVWVVLGLWKRYNFVKFSFLFL
jgi:hypothetical protein